jgi:hypothetical protein
LSSESVSIDVKAREYLSLVNRSSISVIFAHRSGVGVGEPVEVALDSDGGGGVISLKFHALPARLLHPLPPLPRVVVSQFRVA